MNNSPEINENGDQPPFFDSWPKMYLLVLVIHFVLIALFYWFTKYYA